MDLGLQVSGYRVEGFGFLVFTLRFRFEGVGFRFDGSGVVVYGLVFRG